METLPPALARSVFDVIPDGLLLFSSDRNRKIFEGNKAICRMLGYSPEDLPNLSMADIFPRETPDFVLEQLECLPKEGEIASVGEVPLKRKDGSLFYGRVQIVSLEMEKEKYLLGVFRSRPSVKESREALAPAELTRLVTQTVHDVNNPLMIISGNVQLCLMEDMLSEDVKENLGVIAEESVRIKEIVHVFLKSVCPDKMVWDTINGNELVESTLHLAERQLGVSIKRSYAERLAPLWGDEHQLKEVILRFLKNTQGMRPQGSTIVLSTQMEGDYARIDIKNEADGAPEATQKKLFEAFFSAQGKGADAELSVCYDIIKAHGGQLRFESLSGKGAAVIVLLPAKTAGG